MIRRVYAYVAYRVGDGPDAEDVTAEAFERAVRYRDSYDLEKGDPAAWVIGIARRVLVARAGAPTAAALAEVEVGSTEELEPRIVTRLTIADAVAKLRPRDRELVALRYGGDLSAREIGHVLELKTNAVEVALHRARGRLRAELESGSTMRSRTIAQPLAE